jgi:SAM-dependent methyltransferase
MEFEGTVDGAESKAAMAAFWERESCGEVYADGVAGREFYESQSRTRYALEPFIFDFADFKSGKDRDVLEIGVGMGADHLEWAKSRPRSLTGADLTTRAVSFTRERLTLFGFESRLEVADAERLPFHDASFDIVYSWGVLHHSPNTPRAMAEIRRVLRPGGIAKVMVYHRTSIVGYVLWIRYALLAGQPRRSLDDVYAKHLESPGTKAYSLTDLPSLFEGFSSFESSVQLSVGDLMQGAAGQRHPGVALWLARRLWPRRLIRRWFADHGLFLLVTAVK